MSNANNPANISVIYDQLDEEQYPFVNYACWEGADCGYTGDISFANSSGAAYDLALPASVDTLFIHIYDEGDIGDGNVDCQKKLLHDQPAFILIQYMNIDRKRWV